MKGRKEILKMTEQDVNEFWKKTAYNLIIDEHERKAKAALIKQRTAELVAEGIDRSMARTLAKAEFEIEFGI